MTRAMRETREEAEMYKYDKVYYFKTQLKWINMTKYITLKLKEFITSNFLTHSLCNMWNWRSSAVVFSAAEPQEDQ